MDMSNDEIAQLTAESPHFRMLYEQHRLFEKQLRSYDDSAYLSVQEELERKKIQKLKLAGKDEMKQILTQVRDQ
ncbi:MAG: DUF465 domain-containing protein [Desulfuromonadaceae bacterium]|jgi:uncharacterized protein YdcH (DUF465 family)|nr:DUF465 domain-containing protein [Desulfuromonas sp.]MDY0184706.1 DUF465 domain-containing protein [Desulfuromonadaceae bacterium]